jgi:hypothetical protein
MLNTQKNTTRLTRRGVNTFLAFCERTAEFQINLFVTFDNDAATGFGAVCINHFWQDTREQYE